MQGKQPGSDRELLRRHALNPFRTGSVPIATP
jgi:hypothetical protein